MSRIMSTFEPLLHPKQKLALDNHIIILFAQGDVTSKAEMKDRQYMGRSCMSFSLCLLITSFLLFAGHADPVLSWIFLTLSLLFLVISLIIVISNKHTEDARKESEACEEKEKNEHCYSYYCYDIGDECIKLIIIDLVKKVIKMPHKMHLGKISQIDQFVCECPTLTCAEIATRVKKKKSREKSGDKSREKQSPKSRAKANAHDNKLKVPQNDPSVADADENEEEEVEVMKEENERDGTPERVQVMDDRLTRIGIVTCNEETFEREKKMMSRNMVTLGYEKQEFAIIMNARINAIKEKGLEQVKKQYKKMYDIEDSDDEMPENSEEKQELEEPLDIFDVKVRIRNQMISVRSEELEGIPNRHQYVQGASSKKLLGLAEESEDNGEENDATPVCIPRVHFTHVHVDEN